MAHASVGHFKGTFYSPELLEIICIYSDVTEIIKQIVDL